MDARFCGSARSVCAFEVLLRGSSSCTGSPPACLRGEERFPFLSAESERCGSAPAPPLPLKRSHAARCWECKRPILFGENKCSCCLACMLPRISHPLTAPAVTALLSGTLFLRLPSGCRYCLSFLECSSCCFKQETADAWFDLAFDAPGGLVQSDRSPL